MNLSGIKRAAWCLIAVAILSGCAAPRFLDGQEHELGGIALVIDATVVNERLLNPSVIDVSSDNRIALGLEMVAGELLAKKGYQPAPFIRTVGFGFSSAKPIEVRRDMSVPPQGPPNIPPFSIFTRMPAINLAQVGLLHQKAENSPLVIPDRLGKAMPVMVITARGKSIGAGSLLANAGRGAVNVVLSLGARDAVNVMKFEKDTVALSVSLIEGGSGKLLWQECRQLAEDPDNKNFENALRDILKSFPKAQS